MSERNDEGFVTLRCSACGKDKMAAIYSVAEAKRSATQRRCPECVSKGNKAQYEKYVRPTRRMNG